MVKTECITVHRLGNRRKNAFYFFYMLLCKNHDAGSLVSNSALPVWKTRTGTVPAFSLQNTLLRACSRLSSGSTARHGGTWSRCQGRGAQGCTQMCFPRDPGSFQHLGFTQLTVHSRQPAYGLKSVFQNTSNQQPRHSSLCSNFYQCSSLRRFGFLAPGREMHQRESASQCGPVNGSLSLTYSTI